LKTRLQLDDVLEGANIGTLEWNIQTGKIKFNKIWAKNLGYTTTEIKVAQILMGKNGWKSITHPEDIAYAEDMLNRHFSGELPIHSVDVRMRHKKGHWVWIRQEGKVRSWTPDGKPLLMYGTHTDITTRKKAEQEIYELNEHLEERIAQRTAELTQLNKSLVESENKLLNITVEVEERERNRFSSELHDGMGPLLSTIKLYFQWLADTNDPEKRQLITEKGNHSIEMAIQTARELARGLSSQFVTELGFAKAIKEFTQRINDTNKLHIHFDTNTLERFGNFPELMLYRITTELIKNSLTYSQAENIFLRFQLDRVENNISFQYSDNGIGFDWEKIRTERKGLGLMSIINRVQIMKGTIEIKSTVGNGMSVKISLPID
jgi:PAS domain S-box-containing protein